MPIINVIISELVNVNPNLYILRRLAPNIIGIDKKNENSAAIYLEVPRITAPNIVAPDLEVPGIKDNTWNIPMKKAVLYDSSSNEVITGDLFLFLFSIIINKIPYITSMLATTM